jgi:hypothetical protein
MQRKVVGRTNQQSPATGHPRRVVIFNDRADFIVKHNKDDDELEARDVPLGPCLQPSAALEYMRALTIAKLVPETLRTKFCVTKCFSSRSCSEDEIERYS